MSSEMVHYKVFSGERSQKPGKNNDSADLTSSRELFVSPTFPSSGDVS